MTRGSADGGAPVAQLPRPQAGGSPQHLLVTLVADYWFASAGQVPSAALVELLGDFGVSASGARSAISRLAQRDLITGSRHGRHTYYRLSDGARVSLRRGGRKVARFGSTGLDWDGQWTIVAFSVPEDVKEIRPQLRARLRILGFSLLYDGVWISPRADPDDTWAVLDELGVGSATVFRGAHAPHAGPGRVPLAAWDLTSLRQDYDAFLSRFGGVREQVVRGDISARAALDTRTELMDAWRSFPSLDPHLPDELLPADWPRTQARDLFATLYDGLGSLAELRVRQIVQRYAPDLVDQVRHQTTVVMAGGEPVAHSSAGFGGAPASRT